MIIRCGNLPFETTEQDLRQMFAKYGEIHLVKIERDHLGESRGYGHVEMHDDGAAQQAIAELNRFTLDGRMLFLQAVSDNASGLYYSPRFPAA